MKYLFDNNISFRFADALAALEEPVVALRQQFPQDIKDPDLLQALSGSDFVFDSAEKRMKRSLVEAPLLRAAGVTALFFGPYWSKMQFWDQATWLITRWRMIDGFARGAIKGTWAEVKRNGKSMNLPL